MSHHYVRRKIVSAIDSAWFYCPKINLQVDLKAKLKRPKKGLKSFQNVEYLNIQTKLGTDFHIPKVDITNQPSRRTKSTKMRGDVGHRQLGRDNQAGGICSGTQTERLTRWPDY